MCNCYQYVSSTVFTAVRIELVEEWKTYYRKRTVSAILGRTGRISGFTQLKRDPAIIRGLRGPGKNLTGRAGPDLNIWKYHGPGRARPGTRDRIASRAGPGRGPWYDNLAGRTDSRAGPTWPVNISVGFVEVDPRTDPYESPPKTRGGSSARNLSVPTFHILSVCVCSNAIYHAIQYFEVYFKKRLGFNLTLLPLPKISYT